MSRAPVGRFARRAGPCTLVAFTVLLITVMGSGCSNDPEAVLEAARRASRDGDDARAIGLYQEYLVGRPDDFEVLKEYTISLGERWAYDGGDRQPIIDNLDRLYEMRPSDQDVQGLLSLMLIRESQAAAEAGRFEEGEQFLRRAIAVNPESGAAQYNLGVLYETRGDAEQAFAQFRAAAAKRPQIPDLYLRLGRAYLRRDDPDRAITTLSLVVELSGVSTYLLPQAYCGLAQAYGERDMQVEAQEALERAGDDCEVG